MASGLGTTVAVLSSAIQDSPAVRSILFVGGVCTALAGFAVLIRTIAKGAFWGVRAADGMGELMGDPKAHPPVPGLGDRMERMEATVDDVQRTVDSMHQRQDELHSLLTRLVEASELET